MIWIPAGSPSRAKPAGAALADWGRKDASRIAFEQVSHFVMHQLADKHGHHGVPAGHGEGAEPHGPEETAAAGSPFATDLAYVVRGEDIHVDPTAVDPDTGYFLEKLLGHEREGFLWQKLRAPRSYDYKKAENKTYNERYRMPQFPFDDAQREAVMTFVLGLVAEPPAPQFVHNPAPREQARLDGLVVAEQFNCGGCHTFKMDRKRTARLSVPVAALHAAAGRRVARGELGWPAARNARWDAGPRCRDRPPATR